MHQVSGYEKEIKKQEEQKNKIRERYKGVDRNELEFIPAKPREKLFEDTAEKRVCAYCRVSTDDVNQTSSYELQKNHYEDMIKEHQGWELVGIYADEGISGTSLQHRDEFNRMIEDCKAGKIDLIVTKSVSRFARNIVDCIAKVRELGNMRPKVGVFFETEHIYTLDNTSEAIVDRDIYNAAQKMLTVTKYAKKGFPFPNLKVVDGGALKGFVSVNRSWTGFTVEDYKKASQSVYSDQNSIQDIEESKEEKKDGGFDLSGYEIVRAQFFSTRLNPAMTISEGRITFNTACLKKFEDVEYVEILFNSIERCIAVRPCDKDNINAVKWGTIRNGKWAVLPKSCRGFSEPLFELMDWNNECKYRFRGQYSKEDNEQILLFDLEEPEVIKHEIIQEDLPDTDTTETEENTVDTSKNKTKKIVRTLFPKQWQNHFGDSSEDVLLLHRVKYYGNWDVLRPAKIVEGLEPISENLLDKLNEEAQNMIEKMRCAV